VSHARARHGLASVALLALSTACGSTIDDAAASATGAGDGGASTSISSTSISTSSTMGAGGTGGTGGTGGGGIGASGPVPLWFEEAPDVPPGTMSYWQDPRVATDAAGDVFVAGAFEDDDAPTPPLFDGPLTGCDSAASGGHLYVVKFDAAGERTWGRCVGSGTGPAGDDVDLLAFAADADGELVLSGTIGGQADLGLGAFSAAPDEEAFVLRLDPSGAPVFARHSAITPGELAWWLAGLDATGNVFVAGLLGGTDLGIAPTGAGDVFLAEYDASGQPLHAISYESGDVGTPSGGVTVDPTGRLALSGYGAGAPVISSFDPTGTLEWTLAAQGSGEGLVIAFDERGDVLAGGVFFGDVEFGATALASQAPGGVAAFVVDLDPSGEVAWAHALPANDLYSIACDASGRTLVALDIGPSVEFAGGTVPCPGGVIDCGVVAELDVDGTELGAEVVTDSLNAFVRGVACTSDQRIVAGKFAGGPPSIGGHVEAGASAGIFVAALPSD
jgi:hypothetical protein